MHIRSKAQSGQCEGYGCIVAKLDVYLIRVGSCETVTCVSNTRFRLG